MKAAASGRMAEPPGAASVEAMKAIVQDEYGTTPEKVLRLAEAVRPATGEDQILVRVVPPAWTGAHGI